MAAIRNFAVQVILSHLSSLEREEEDREVEDELRILIRRVRNSTQEESSEVELKLLLWVSSFCSTYSGEGSFVVVGAKSSGLGVLILLLGLERR